MSRSYPRSGWDAKSRILASIESPSNELPGPRLTEGQFINGLGESELLFVEMRKTIGLVNLMSFDLHLFSFP